MSDGKFSGGSQNRAVLQTTAIERYKNNARGECGVPCFRGPSTPQRTTSRAGPRKHATGLHYFCNNVTFLIGRGRHMSKRRRWRLWMTAFALLLIIWLAVLYGF